MFEGVGTGPKRVNGMRPAYAVRHQTSLRQQKRAPEGALNLRGAAYRIRTYDALIRSQVLYPAEVTPRARSNNASLAPIRQTTLVKI